MLFPGDTPPSTAFFHLSKVSSSTLLRADCRTEMSTHFLIFSMPCTVFAKLDLLRSCLLVLLVFPFSPSWMTDSEL